MAFLTIHARTREIMRDTVSPANRREPDTGDASRGVARVVSGVSVLCPRCVARSDNDRLWPGRTGVSVTNDRGDAVRCGLAGRTA